MAERAPGTWSFRKEPLKLVPPLQDEKDLRWRAFVKEVRILDSLEPESSNYEAALVQWVKVQAAYRDLREAWVKPRKPTAKEDRPQGHDATVTAFLDARGLFLNRYWGFETEAGEGKRPKRNGSADPAIRAVMTLYQSQWDEWHKRTSGYRAYKQTENKRRNQLDHVKAKKAAWAQSPEGKAWKAKYLKDAKEKRAAAREAKLAAKEAMKNV